MGKRKERRTEEVRGGKVRVGKRGTVRNRMYEGNEKGRSGICNSRGRSNSKRNKQKKR